MFLISTHLKNRVIIFVKVVMGGVTIKKVLPLENNYLSILVNKNDALNFV